MDQWLPSQLATYLGVVSEIGSMSNIHLKNDDVLIRFADQISKHGLFRFRKISFQPSGQNWKDNSTKSSRNLLKIEATERLGKKIL